MITVTITTTMVTVLTTSKTTERDLAQRMVGRPLSPAHDLVIDVKTGEGYTLTGLPSYMKS